MRIDGFLRKNRENPRIFVESGPELWYTVLGSREWDTKA